MTVVRALAAAACSEGARTKETAAASPSLAAASHGGMLVPDTSLVLGFVPRLVGRGHRRARAQRLEGGGQVFTDIPVTYPPAVHA